MPSSGMWCCVVHGATSQKTAYYVHIWLIFYKNLTPQKEYLVMALVLKHQNDFWGRLKWKNK
jgi:hypothetical protein